MNHKTKILDKIKKCLALGKSSNANEAATALRQAQKLMEKHGVTEEDIEALGYGSETVDIPVQANKKLPQYIEFFLHLMQHAFGVRAVTGSNVRISDVSYTVSYFGPTGRVMTAAYAHQVCWRAMNKAWNDELKINPYFKGRKGARMGFFIGWIEEVWSKVEAIGFTDEEQVKTEIAIKQTGLKLRKNEISTAKVYNSMVNAGMSAGRKFNIHRPVGESKLGLEKL